MLDFYYSFTALLGDYLIRGIFISVIVLAITQRLFKKVDIQYAKSILKWIMIGYAGLCFIQLIFLVSFDTVEESFVERAMGEYWFSYWFMWTACTILPMILFFRRIGDKLIFLFLVAVFINGGWLLESFVIHVTSIHLDSIPSDYEMKRLNPFLPSKNELKVLLRGLILGILVLGIGQSLIRNEEQGPIDKAFRL